MQSSYFQLSNSTLYSQVSFSPTGAHVTALTPSSFLVIPSNCKTSATDIALLNEWKEYSTGSTPFCHSHYPSEIANESTNCFMLASKDHPVVLYDLSGYSRQTYKTLLNDEYLQSYSVRCLRSSVIAGCKGTILRFDLDGRESGRIGLKKFGIVSCMDVDTTENIVTVGSFKQALMLIDLRTSDALYHEKTLQGLSQISMMDDGHLIYTRQRKSDSVRCLDLRNYQYLPEFERMGSSGNQRLHYGIEKGTGRMVVGNREGSVTLYEGESEIIWSVDGPVSCDLHGNLVVTVSGQREFFEDEKVECKLELFDCSTS